MSLTLFLCDMERFIAIFRVALGNTKDLTQLDTSLSEPPSGFNSCHGVKRTSDLNSEFDDDEYAFWYV